MNFLVTLFTKFKYGSEIAGVISMAMEILELISKFLKFNKKDDNEALFEEVAKFVYANLPDKYKEPVGTIKEKELKAAAMSGFQFYKDVKDLTRKDK